ncbi:quinone oxidoreductase [[Pseudomonas] carboxydohydrogena]|uniref:Quinone oxidoreductase n=1 Tax=Afipia carboxydohydrogena TaxID=290 RepID=A0ABY8BLV1_AFICR|nr:quinone oxidoreductase [[Pseudomonas] carboxydohydrogena]WEF50964.1 quinone oxidoreductase [[Pseudomonas] carboxydohydrogena]
MKAISINQFGGPEVCEIQETAIPAPAAGEVLVRVAYSGINFIDVYMRNGTYARSHTYKTPLPMVIGMEASGTVEAIGDGVSDIKVDQRVAFCLSRGSYAEYVAVPAWKLVPLPGDISLEIGAAAMLQGCTAHYLSHSAFPLQRGQSCLVHAGAGGVGQLLIQFAKHLGATVFTTVSTPEKADIASSRGADHCILYRDTNFREEIMKLTSGKGVDVVYDSVGKTTIADSIRCVRRRGLCVLFGASSGVVDAIEPLALAEAGSVFFTRPHLADYMVTADEIRGRAGDLFRLVKEKRLSMTIDTVFPLADAASAHRHIEGGKTRGKLLLQVQ